MNLWCLYPHRRECLRTYAAVMTALIPFGVPLLYTYLLEWAYRARLVVYARLEADAVNGVTQAQHAHMSEAEFHRHQLRRASLNTTQGVQADVEDVWRRETEDTHLPSHSSMQSSLSFCEPVR